MYLLLYISCTIFSCIGERSFRVFSFSNSTEDDRIVIYCHNNIIVASTDNL